MHVLFVHQNYPAQFGHIARHLIRTQGWQCSFVTQNREGVHDGIRLVPYKPRGGATARTHYCARTFENAVAHCHGVYDACRAAIGTGLAIPAPDLIVGHSGFGSTLFLRELYDCPIINYLEYFYHPHDSDLDFRPDFPPRDLDILRSYCRNAMILLDLENCTAGYCPTQWQKSLLPAAFADKVEVIFDGIDTELWKPRQGDRETRRQGDRETGRRGVEMPPDLSPCLPVSLSPCLAGREVTSQTRIVTYVARGMEAMRGFDIFMEIARNICREMPDVLFVVVGSDRVAYGGDLNHITEKSFREHVLKQGDYDSSRFLFPGLMPMQDLARLLARSDLHIYLTVPFVLSWSLFNALACGCAVVASGTDPVKELIEHERTGLLADFFDVDGLTDLSLRVLREPEKYRFLGENGAALIETQYSLARCLPRMIDLYRRALSAIIH